MDTNKETLVAISGRPNVGKSCLFNRLLGKRQSIVEPTSGVTRDRVYATVTWGKKEFQLVDTGGIHFEAKTEMSDQIIKQAQKGIDEANLILFIVDSTAGLTPEDWGILNFLRKANRKIILVVNKVDDMSKITHLTDFYELGIEPMVFVSALHGLNIDELLDIVVEHLKPGNRKKEIEETALKVALIGKPNVGKSSFFNTLIKEERVIVSDVPGTTRDSVDTRVTVDGHDYLMIDTAGIKRKKRPKEAIDLFSRSRTIQAVKRADVCIVLIDAQVGLRRDDLHILSLIKDEDKCCVIGINKCDLVKLDIEACQHTLTTQAYYMNFAFSILCSAKNGKNVHAALALAREAWNNSQYKIKQGALAETLDKINEHLRRDGLNPSLKIQYITQLRVNPPVFAMIVNKPELVKAPFLRFIESRIRSSYNFKGTPIKIIVKKKGVS
ncbi:MAG: ribosome biogenesis GTPase Der [Candidatus Omnitrophica bacterium]|nr:ribosome biogenesis GTPase Der [Candidatus Omnitrophota bacterium]